MHLPRFGSQELRQAVSFWVGLSARERADGGPRGPLHTPTSSHRFSTGAVGVSGRPGAWRTSAQAAREGHLRGSRPISGPGPHPRLIESAPGGAGAVSERGSRVTGGDCPGVSLWAGVDCGGSGDQRPRTESVREEGRKGGEAMSEAGCGRREGRGVPTGDICFLREGTVPAGDASRTMLTAWPPKFTRTLGPRRLKGAGPPMGPEIVSSSERLSLRLHPDSRHCGGRFFNCFIVFGKISAWWFYTKFKSSEEKGAQRAHSEERVTLSWGGDFQPHIGYSGYSRTKSSGHLGGSFC